MNDTDRPDFFGRVDLASARLGGVVLEATDDFFAEKEKLIQPQDPVWIEGKYTDRGKWMDGWESRRRRTPGHDWCVVQLAAIGRIDDLVVDTAHFTGNFPEACSIEGWLGTGVPGDDAEWVELLPETTLQGDTLHHFEAATPTRCSHLRLHIYPDGGVARLRAYGEVLPDWDAILDANELVDLVGVLQGGTVLDCSDRFYSAPENMLLPDASRGMHDGWETRRRRGPGHDWCVFALGRAGTIRKAEVHTSHFKGNYPDRASLELASLADGADPATADWREVLAETKLEADQVHTFDLGAAGMLATHARLNIYPDGGVARLRLLGDVAR